MEEEKELACFCAYLQTRERSEGTIEKYQRDLKRYFRDVNADKWLSHEGAVQWRDALVRQGYAAVSINAMLAAVNGYFIFRRRMDCCARPLKRQRRAFCAPDRELDPQEYRCLLRTARKEKQNRLLMILQTMASTGIRVSEFAAHHGGGRAPGPCGGALQGQMPGNLPAPRPVRKAQPVVQKAGPCQRQRLCDPQRPPHRPLQPLARNESPVQTRRDCVQQGVPTQSAASVRQGFLPD